MAFTEGEKTFLLKLVNEEGLTPTEAVTRLNKAKLKMESPLVSGVAGIVEKATPGAVEKLEGVEALTPKQKTDFDILKQQGKSSAEALEGATEKTIGETAVDVGKGALKGLGSTLAGASELGQRGLESAAGAVGLPTREVERPAALEEALTPEGTAEKVGFFGEQIAEFFIPGVQAAKVGKAIARGEKIAQLPKLLRPIAKAGAVTVPEAVVGGGVTALQEGEIGEEAAIGAVAGAAIPVAGKALGLTKRFLGGFLKRIGGVVTGKGTNVIEKIIEKPLQAQKGLRGEETRLLKELGTSVRTKINELARAASKRYADSLEALPKTRLSLDGLKTATTNKLEQFGVNVGKKGVLDFTEAPFKGSEEKVIEKAVNLINGWKDTTPEGINRLAVKLGLFRRGGAAAKNLNNVIDSLKRNAREFLGAEVPAVRELNATFGKTQDFLEALRSELGVKGATDSTKGLIATTRKIQQLFNSNKEVARELVEQLEREVGIDVVGVEAGRQLAAAPSRAQTSIGDAFRGAVQAVIPPRLIGELAAATGIAQQKLAPVLQALAGLDVTERFALISALKALTENQ